MKPLYYIIFISEALNRENSFECIQKSSRLRVNYFLRALINLSPPGMSLVNKLFLDNFWPLKPVPLRKSVIAGIIKSYFSFLSWINVGRRNITGIATGEHGCPKRVSRGCSFEIYRGELACRGGGALWARQQCWGEFFFSVRIHVRENAYYHTLLGVCLWRVWLANLGTDWETGFKIWSDFVKDFFGGMIFHLFVTVNDYRLR